MLIDLIAIIGKSGSGKNTILKNFLQKYTYNNLNIIVPFTTRPKRAGEIEGKDYFFLDMPTVNQLIENNEIVQVESFNNWLYGTLRKDLKADKINIGIYNPKAVKALSKNKELNITTIYIVASGKDRLLRQLQREDSPDVQEIIRRYGADEQDFLDDEINLLPNVIRIENPNIYVPKEKQSLNGLFTYAILKEKPVKDFSEVVAQMGKFN